MRVLGIDPGSRLTGFGVVDISAGNLAYVASGVVKAPTDVLPQRLKVIYDGVYEVIETHQPDIIVVEKVFIARNAQSALILGHARGAAICAGVNQGLPVSEYTALQIKQAVVGRGHAAKEQVQHMVQILLKLAAPPQEDAADALACAICYIHSTQGGAQRLDQAARALKVVRS
ncbi:MAG TPA: crossover junction endodeoxyribonuclease RuvC [Acidiferrobacteraceae bacterium]|nr:crossover junction endodeoxyribonuclease RuvC [Acidiferrobacteraceae bacterium]